MVFKIVCILVLWIEGLTGLDVLNFDRNHRTLTAKSANSMSGRKYLGTLKTCVTGPDILNCDRSHRKLIIKSTKGTKLLQRMRTLNGLAWIDVWNIRKHFSYVSPNTMSSIFWNTCYRINHKQLEHKQLEHWNTCLAWIWCLIYCGKLWYKSNPKVYGNCK